MHVRRHLNRLFGSFRNSEKNRKQISDATWVEGAGPSQWELANHEEIKADVSQMKSTLCRDAKIQDPFYSFNYGPPEKEDGKKPSLLKRTWSSKKRKANHKMLQENESNGNIPIEEGLADVVQEINATIGMMNQYSLLHHNYEQLTEKNTLFSPNSVTVNDCEPVGNFQWETDFSESKHLQQSEIYQNLDFEPNWACFDDHSTTQTILSNEVPSPKLEKTKFLQSLDANTQIVANNENKNPQTNNYSIFERPNHKMQTQRTTSNLRRSGRRIYDTLRRSGDRKEMNQDSDLQGDDKLSCRNRDTTAKNVRNWVSRSFRKVVKRKQTTKRSSSYPDLRRADDLTELSVKINKPIPVTETKGIGKMFTKRLMVFGRSMVAASTLMPLDFEHPSYPNDSTYPRAYYEEDEDAIYEFRKYCEEQEWNRVHCQQQPERQRAYQAGYC